VRTQTGIDQVRGEFIQRRCAGIHPVGQYSFGQVGNFLETLAGTDHQLALHKQLFERLLGGLPVPPAAVGFAAVFEIAGA